ncbi:hypothetical protein [Arthrobacter sp. SLBN-100]|uniref:hypothetical protein n=1 Tax=Arthrobacter sp. SLBN-100 TaxID=2768450 RepID=UPI003FA49058
MLDDIVGALWKSGHSSPPRELSIADSRNFRRPGTPAITKEYVTYREATLDFIANRNHRIDKWCGTTVPTARDER